MPEMQNDISQDLLNGIYEYLRTRLPEDIHIFSFEGNEWQDPYIGIDRRRYRINITVDGNIAALESNLTNPTIMSVSRRREVEVNLQLADSLQQIFEWIMGKRNA
jgi:hypothetical protein